MVELPLGFQPAGRSPAPPPLDLVQEFVNSEVPVWAIDEIATPEQLVAWFRARELVQEGAVADAGSFVHARALRRVLRELAARNTQGLPPETELRAAFASVAAETRLRLVLDDRGELRVEPSQGGVEGALAEILARVLEAQSSGAWRRLKSCPGPHCGWLFYDGSRNASSKWCSMSICGNRTKTAAYRSRKRSA